MIVARATVRQKIRDLLGTSDKPLSSAELARLADCDQSYANSVLAVLEFDGDAVRVAGGGRGVLALWARPS